MNNQAASSPPVDAEGLEQEMAQGCRCRCHFGAAGDFFQCEHCSDWPHEEIAEALSRIQEPWRITRKYPMMVGYGVALQRGPEIRHEEETGQVLGLYLGREHELSTDDLTFIAAAPRLLRAALSAIQTRPVDSWEERYGEERLSEAMALYQTVGNWPAVCARTDGVRTMAECVERLVQDVDTERVAAIRQAEAALSALRDAQQQVERWFPIQPERGAAPHPIRIPWSVAEQAYSVYAARYGCDQSLERLAERSGFHPSEMDDFLPDWREQCGEISTLRKRASAAEAQRDALRRQVERLRKHEEELRLQAGIFSRRNWGTLNEQGNVEMMPGLLDTLSVRLEQAADELSALLVSEPLAESDNTVVALWKLLHWERPEVQPPPYYSPEQQGAWRQAMAQARTIVAYYQDHGIGKEAFNLPENEPGGGS